MIDEFSRESLAIEVDTPLSSKRVIRVLNRLKAERGLPLEIGIDQGPEFTSKVLMGWAKDHGVNLHFCTPGDKNENAFIWAKNVRVISGNQRLYQMSTVDLASPSENL